MSDAHTHYIVLPADANLPINLQTVFIRRDPAGADQPVVYFAQAASGEQNEMIGRILQDMGFARVFERCWLPAECPAAERAALVQTLFASIANTYDSLITADYNRQCYECLYAIAQNAKHSAGLRVLDFGCGTGIITQTAFIGELEILKGFDFCPQMVAIARAKGLDVLAPPLCARPACERFDMILASYVLHFGLRPSEWQSLLALLVDGGVLVANFHKGFGLTEALQYITLVDAGRHTHQIVPSAYGPILTIYKALSQRQ